MTLFTGIHEVVCKRADGKLYIGYFDDEQKALASVENDSTYQALWYSLNPLKDLPEGAKLNGPLARSRRSKKDWMPQRKRLLIDIDPLREYGNSSDAEKAAALRQGQAIEQHLRELGWPEPMFCDSGNGYHLLYTIDLPSHESGDLIRHVLLALAKKFDNAETHVDTGVFDANRVAKLPGSWARKAPETPERPHRQASIVRCPEELRPVSRDLLEQVAAGYTPENGTLETPANDQLKIEWLRGFLEHYNVPVLHERRTGQRYFTDVECPWLEEHHSPSGDTTSSVGYERGWGYSYKCFHSECTKEKRGWQEFKQKVIALNPDAPGYGNPLPNLPSECSHADIARYFIEHEPAAKNHVNLMT